MHRKNQTHQSEEMIAMQVTNKNVIDAMEVDLKAHKLHLHSLTTINQKMIVLYLNQLRRWMSPIGRHRSTGAQYRNFKTQGWPIYLK